MDQNKTMKFKSNLLKSNHARFLLSSILSCIGLFGLIRCNSEKASEFSKKAGEAVAQGAYEQAISLYQEALKLNPSSNYAQSNLGYVYIKQKKWKEAAEAFNQAVRLDKQGRYHYQIGYAYEQLNQNLEAIKQFEEAATLLEKDPSQKELLSQSYYHIGLLQRKQGNLSAADQSYRRSLTHNSRFKEAYLQLADLYMQEDFPKEAALVLENALLSSPEDKEIFFRLGKAWRSAKEYTKALTYFKQAFSRPSSVKLSAYYMALIYLATDDKKNAISMLEAYLSDPGSDGAETAVPGAIHLLQKLKK